MYKNWDDFYKVYGSVDKESAFNMLVYQYIEVNYAKKMLEDGTTNHMITWLDLKGFREKLVDEILYRTMLDVVKKEVDFKLCFNSSVGRYGVALSNTQIWVKEALQSGENIVVQDHFGHWISDTIMVDPHNPIDIPIDNPDAWYLESTRFSGQALSGLSVKLV